VVVPCPQTAATTCGRLAVVVVLLFCVALKAHPIMLIRVLLNQHFKMAPLYAVLTIASHPLIGPVRLLRLILTATVLAAKLSSQVVQLVQ